MTCQIFILFPYTFFVVQSKGNVHLVPFILYLLKLELSFNEFKNWNKKPCQTYNKCKNNKIYCITPKSLETRLRGVPTQKG